ncbi:MAG: M1 family aminopeptidase, partial [Desulfobulbaceae bacterium]|nr:M1 family aminopeptidase [Desulfobulbaceae bacterium]
MIIFFPQLRIPLILLTSFLITAGIYFPSTAQGEEIQTMPEHAVSITFNLQTALLTGTSKITLPPGTPLTLHCGPLEITGSVLEVEGTSQLSLVPDANNVISLPSSTKMQTVYLSWKLSASNPYADNNLISENGITLAGFWHPIPDIDMHYRLEAELPGNFTGISEGETVTYCKDRYNARYLNTIFDHPVRSIHFAAGSYTVKYKKLDNDIELAAFFFDEDIALADDYLDKAASYIKRYETLIGPFPYNRYSIVENRLPTGYGMPTFTLLGQAVVRLPFIKDTSLGHEILHSWFGNSVFLDESSGNWSESLTTYLADHMYAEDQGKGSEYRKNQLLRYISYVHQDNEMTLQDFTNASDSQPMARKVRAIGYDKGSMLFHMLRIQLGDEAFFQGISAFYRKMKDKRAGWEDIEDIFTETAETDLTEFFDQWLTRWDLPQFSISNLDISQIEGRSKISFKVEQKNVQPYRLLLPVITKTRTGEFQDIIELSGRQTDVEISVDELPFELLVDPGYDMMRDLSEDEIPPVWSFFLGAKNKFAVLASQDEAQIYAPLISYLESIDCETVTADEIDNSDLNDGSFIFLGSSRHSQGLFAAPDYPGTGFSLDMRKNPLNSREVMVLVTSSDEQETAQVVRKLGHYGKYSFLHFQKGQLQTSSIDLSRQGMSIELFAEPKGVRVPDIRSFDDIVDELQQSKVIYAGEIHTDMGNHILQLQ